MTEPVINVNYTIMSAQREWTPEEKQFIEKALATIPKTPLERITENVRRVREKGNFIYDVHVHAFDKGSINESYFVVQFIREYIKDRVSLVVTDDSISAKELIAQQLLEDTGAESIEDFYSGKKEIPSWGQIKTSIQTIEGKLALVSGSDNEGTKSKSEFLRFLLDRFFPSNSHQAQMLDFYYKYYSLHEQVPEFKGKDTITCLLMMDFYREYKGFPDKSMWQQIHEINELADKENGHPVLPFLALDPRRVSEADNENLYNLFLKAFDRNQGGRFFGVKLYPALGYSVSDYRLEPFYKVCEELNIPVVSHCGGEIVSTFSPEIKVFREFNQEEVVVEENLAVDANPRRRRIFNLNDPSEFKPVLARYNKLKLNIAHFGGNESWTPLTKYAPYHERVGTTFTLMNEYKGVFTDFAFCLTDKATYKELNKVIRHNLLLKERIMYGTDYWVVLFNDDDKFAECLQQFTDNVLEHNEIMERMVTNNPEDYLFKVI